MCGPFVASFTFVYYKNKESHLILFIYDEIVLSANMQSLLSELVRVTSTWMKANFEIAAVSFNWTQYLLL